MCVDTGKADSREDGGFQFPDCFKVFLKRLLRVCVCVLLVVVGLFYCCVVSLLY